MAGRPLRPRRGRLLAAAAVALALLVTGCTAPPSPSATPASGGRPLPSATASSTPAAPRSTTPLVSTEWTPSSRTPGSPATLPGLTTTVTTVTPETVTPATVTRTRTRPGATVTITVAPPKPTAAPAATDGTCPYLSADVVSEITGQHHGPTQLVPFDPHPMCVFYRSDGGRMGSVRIIQAASAAAAAAAVDQHVPVAGSQPATQPAGWSGGSMTSPGQMTQDSQALSVYAVSRGTIAVVAEENESPSLKARLMAVCAIHGLGLEPGPTPDYCAEP